MESLENPLQKEKFAAYTQFGDIFEDNMGTNCGINVYLNDLSLEWIYQSQNVLPSFLIQSAKTIHHFPIQPSELTSTPNLPSQIKLFSDFSN